MAHSTTSKDKAGFTNPAGMADAARETAAGFGEAARGAATAVADKASEAATFIGKKAESATSAVGSGMKSLAGTIREHTPHEGMLGSAGGAVAKTLQSGGDYLEQHGLEGIGEDVTGLIRRNPIPSVLIGIGIGFLLARATRS